MSISPADSSLRSMPVENARPAPVTITILVAWSAASASAAVLRSIVPWLPNALSRSVRSRRKRLMAPSRDNSMVASRMSYVMSRSRRDCQRGGRLGRLAPAVPLGVAQCGMCRAVVRPQLENRRPAGGRFMIVASPGILLRLGLDLLDDGHLELA